MSVSYVPLFQVFLENRMGPIQRDVGPREVLEFAHPHACLGGSFQRIAVRRARRPPGSAATLPASSRAGGPGYWSEQPQADQWIPGEKVSSAGMVDHLPENRRLGADRLGGLSLVHPQCSESINEGQIDLDHERPAKFGGDLPHQLERMAILDFQPSAILHRAGQFSRR